MITMLNLSVTNHERITKMNEMSLDERIIFALSCVIEHVKKDVMIHENIIKILNKDIAERHSMVYRLISRVAHPDKVVCPPEVFGWTTMYVKGDINILKDDRLNLGKYTRLTDDMNLNVGYEYLDIMNQAAVSMYDTIKKQQQHVTELMKRLKEHETEIVNCSIIDKKLQSGNAIVPYSSNTFSTVDILGYEILILDTEPSTMSEEVKQLINDINDIGTYNQCSNKWEKYIKQCCCSMLPYVKTTYTPSSVIWTISSPEVDTNAYILQENIPRTIDPDKRDNSRFYPSTNNNPGVVIKVIDNDRYDNLEKQENNFCLFTK